MMFFWIATCSSASKLAEYRIKGKQSDGRLGKAWQIKAMQKSGKARERQCKREARQGMTRQGMKGNAVQCKAKNEAKQKNYQQE